MTDGCVSPHFVICLNSSRQSFVACGVIISKSDKRFPKEPTHTHTQTHTHTRRLLRHLNLVPQDLNRHTGASPKGRTVGGSHIACLRDACALPLL